MSLAVYRSSKVAKPNTPTETALLEDFAGMLRADGGKVTVVSEIQRVQ